MEAEPTDARPMRDYELNESLEASEADELDGLSIQNQRLARIQEYEEEAVTRADPLSAVIGMGNAYFQRIFEHLGAALLEAIDGRPHTVYELREFGPDIRLLLKVRNAIETDIALQSPDVTPQAAAFPPGVKGKGANTKAATGKRDLLPKHWRGNTSF